MHRHCFSKFLITFYCSLTSFKRTSGYFLSEDGKYYPLFDEKEIISESAAFKTEINIKCCQEFVQKLLLLGIAENAYLIINKGIRVLSSFMNNPNTYYLKALIGIKMSQSQYNSRYLIDRLTVTHLLNKTFIWYEGSFKYSYGNVGLFFFNKIGNLCLKIIQRLK